MAQMGVTRYKNFFSVVFIFFTLLASCHQQLVAATRPLEGEQWVKKEGRLAFQSLQRGPVPPSGPNPCGNVPGQGSGTCTRTLNNMNIAGPVLRAPPAFPSLVLDVAVASTGNNNHAHYQDQSS